MNFISKIIALLKACDQRDDIVLSRLVRNRMAASTIESNAVSWATTTQPKKICQICGFIYVVSLHYWFHQWTYLHNSAMDYIQLRMCMFRIYKGFNSIIMPTEW